MQTKIFIVFSDQLNIKFMGGTSFSCLIFRANFVFACTCRFFLKYDISWIMKGLSRSLLRCKRLTLISFDA